MGEFYCRLENILEELGINENKLSVVTGIRKQTLYLMSRNELKRLEMEYPKLILDALNDIAKEKELEKQFLIDDLFKYTYKK